MSQPATNAPDACHHCGSANLSFVRFMLFNGRLSTEVEVSVHQCDGCTRKMVSFKRVKPMEASNA